MMAQFLKLPSGAVINVEQIILIRPADPRAAGIHGTSFQVYTTGPFDQGIFLDLEDGEALIKAIQPSQA
jgi:hypothetical protein